jgi:phosphatidylglycerophosphatase C
MDEASTAQPRVAVFDFDGVLVRGDSFESFLRSRLRAQPWRLILALPVLPLVPLLMSTAAGKGWLARVFTRVATLGHGEAGFRRIVLAFARRFGANPENFLVDGLAQVRAHLAAGDRVIIASATEAHLLDCLLHSLQLSQLERIGSHVSASWVGLRVHRHNYGETKPALLRERFGLTRWEVAYSDAWSDLPLLEPAAEAVLVNPTPALAQRFLLRLDARLQVVRWN